jgi:MFS transporter, DHA1 family, inner membrane transport protein
LILVGASRLALGAPTSANSTHSLMSSTASASPTATRPFPWVGLFVLAAAIFLTVTSETLPTGLLPQMSSSLGVSEPAIGLLVTIFAFTVVASTVPLTAVTRRLPRHGMIVGILVVLALSNMLTALSPTYAFVVGSRILGGAAHGLFWAVVGAYAGHLVPKEQIGRAVSITLGGGTLAFVVGVPIGTSVGHVFGWRFVFAAVAVLMLAGAALVWKFLPAVDRTDHAAVAAAAAEVARAASAEEVPIVAPSRGKDRTIAPVIGVCILTATIITGHYALYTYIVPFMTGEMGISSGNVGGLLFVYGIAGAIGLVISGTVLGSRPQLGIILAIAVSGVSVAALAVFAALPLVAIPALFLWGVAFGTIPPAFQTRLLHTSSQSFRDTASALYSSAFNVGIGGGALLGALLFGISGVQYLPAFYICVLAVSLILAIALGRTNRAHLTP